jgi:hypothetical protein
MIIDNLFTRPIFESQTDPITQFASNAHEEWRKNFDPTGTKPRVKRNSDGTEGDINVPFEKLHPDWKKENLAAAHSAHHAVKHFGRDMEKAAEHVHNEWMKRNPKGDWNAAQHVPYDDLPDDEKEKDRVHVRTMQQLLGHNPEQNIDEASAANDYFTRRKSEEDRIAGIKAPAKNKKNPANTDYAKKRKQQDVTEAGHDHRRRAAASHDDEECSSCDGTGEGRHEGQSCGACGGSGVARGHYNDDDFEIPDKDDMYEGVAEGVAKTLPMSDAVKVLRQYGADHFKTTSNELHFYKKGKPFSVDLIFNNDATRSVSLSSLNSATRGLKGQGVAEGNLKEFAPGPSGGGGNDENYLKELARAWYTMDLSVLGHVVKQGKHALDHIIDVQESVERLLQRGIHCPDGKVRKYEIGYNSAFDGVHMQSHDHYEHSDTDDAGNDIDDRTGEPWGPYDVLDFSGRELNESANPVVAESNTLMKKLHQALLQEGRVKELADDLKTLNDAEFVKKYGKAKAAIRRDMKKVDEGNANSGRRNPIARPDNVPVKLGRIEKLKTGIKHHADSSRYGGTVPDTDDDHLLSPASRHHLHKAVTPDYDIDEARTSAAQRLSTAWDRQRAKSDASLARTPGSIPKKQEPKKAPADPGAKTVSEHRVKRRALMAQMLNSR